MPTKAQIKKKIKEFIESTDSEFTDSNLLDFIETEFALPYLTENQMDHALDMLDYDLNYLVAEKRIQDDEYEDSIFVSRNNLFKNSKFLIKPTDYELKRGILVSGHRFTPFCSPLLSPDKITLYDIETKKNISKKKVTARTEDLYIYFTFLGIEAMFYNLSKIKENTEFFLDTFSDNSELFIRVNNLSSFYKKHSFRSGDYILAEVSDYYKGRCNIEYLPISSIKNSIGEITNWCLELENAILETVKIHELFSAELDIYKQLSEAFYIADRKLLKKPMIHLGGFLSLSKKIHLVNQDRFSLLWDKSKNFTPPGISLMNQKLNELQNPLLPEVKKIGNKKLNNLNNILEYMGYSFNSDELEAYMRDELFSGNKDINNVKARCYDNRDVYYPELVEKLDNLTIKLWNKVINNYNIFADKKVGSLRKQLLELNDKNIRWQRNIDNSNGKVSLDDIPQEVIEILLQMAPQLAQLIIDLNKPQTINNNDIKLLKKMIKQAIPMMSMIIDNMNEIVDDLIRKA